MGRARICLKFRADHVVIDKTRKRRANSHPIDNQHFSRPLTEDSLTNTNQNVKQT